MQVRYSMPLRSLVVSLLVLSAPTTAAAGIPSAANSTVPNRLVACPAGDVSFRVVVRDIGDFPVASSAVTIDLTACPGVALCPIQRPEVTYDSGAHRLSMFTDANGVADFRLKLGGVCPAGVELWADGYYRLTYLPIPVASPDQNADLLVSSADVVIASALLNTHDTGADLDCDGTVTEADLAWINDLHGGHSCDNVVPARTATWGSVKIRYR